MKLTLGEYKKSRPNASVIPPCHDPDDREDLLVEVLRNGLPKLLNGSCHKDVTVVGAGMSGLTGGHKSQL
jgi:hypothetical protein